MKELKKFTGQQLQDNFGMPVRENLYNLNDEEIRSLIASGAGINPANLISTEANNTITIGTDGKLFSVSVELPQSSDMVTSVGHGGNTVSRRYYGLSNPATTDGVFSYWGTGASTTWTVPYNTWTYLALPSDFPELAQYQGSPIYGIANILNPTTDTIYNATLMYKIDSNGFAVNTSSTAGQLIGAGNIISFSQLLVL